MCFLPVRKDWGLKKPDIQTTPGRVRSCAQESSSRQRRRRSLYLSSSRKGRWGAQKDVIGNGHSQTQYTSRTTMKLNYICNAHICDICHGLCYGQNKPTDFRALNITAYLLYCCCVSHELSILCLSLLRLCLYCFKIVFSSWTHLWFLPKPT